MKIKSILALEYKNIVERTFGPDMEHRIYPYTKKLDVFTAKDGFFDLRSKLWGISKKYFSIEIKTNEI